VEDVPAHGRGLELDDLLGPFQPKPFYDSMIVAGKGCPQGHKDGSKIQLTLNCDNNVVQIVLLISISIKSI